MAIEGASQLVLAAVDQGFNAEVAQAFSKLNRATDPAMGLTDFVMEVQKAADTWTIARDALEEEFDV